VIDPWHFRDYIVRPVLKEMQCWSVDAENLLCGTALVESRLKSLVQTPSGYAKGVFQIEEPTYQDVAKRFRERHFEKSERFLRFAALTALPPHAGLLIGNMYIGCYIARAKYYLNPEPVPSELEAQAEYWNRIYNTRIDKEAQQRYIECYLKAYC